MGKENTSTCNSITIDSKKWTLNFAPIRVEPRNLKNVVECLLWMILYKSDLLKCCSIMYNSRTLQVSVLFLFPYAQIWAWWFPHCANARKLKLALIISCSLSAAWRLRDVCSVFCSAKPRQAPGDARDRPETALLNLAQSSWQCFEFCLRVAIKP